MTNEQSDGVQVGLTVRSWKRTSAQLEDAIGLAPDDRGDAGRQPPLADGRRWYLGYSYVSYFSGLPDSPDASSQVATLVDRLRPIQDRLMHLLQTQPVTAKGWIVGDLSDRFGLHLRPEDMGMLVDLGVTLDIYLNFPKAPYDLPLSREDDEGDQARIEIIPPNG